MILGYWVGRAMFRVSPKISFPGLPYSTGFARRAVLPFAEEKSFEASTTSTNIMNRIDNIIDNTIITFAVMLSVRTIGPPSHHITLWSTPTIDYSTR